MVTQSQHRHCTDRWYLQGWGATHTDYDTMIPSSLTSRVQECFNAQSHLGWTGFLEGFLTTNLAVVKQDYFTCKGSWQTGHRWIVNVSKQLWQLVFTHWTHQNHQYLFLDPQGAWFRLTYSALPLICQLRFNNILTCNWSIPLPFQLGDQQQH